MAKLGDLPPTTSLVGEDLGPCPFCQGALAYSMNPPAVLHELPVCTKYAKLDADVFLIAVRDALIGAKPS